MKKFLLIMVLLVALFGIAYGQTAPENKWMLGTWSAVWLNMIIDHSSEITFRDDGTCLWDGGECLYSINGNILTRFSDYDNTKNTIRVGDLTIYRISDKLMFLNTGGREPAIIKLDKK